MKDVPTIGLLDRVEEHLEIPPAIIGVWKELRERAVRSAPIVHCPACGEIMEVSLEAAYHRDGQWLSAFQMNQALAMCRNKECEQWRELRVYDRKPEGLVEVAD